jgi:hypothetical protein
MEQNAQRLVCNWPKWEAERIAPFDDRTESSNVEKRSVDGRTTTTLSFAMLDSICQPDIDDNHPP